MENYKVRVSNEAESKEVQGLFEQLGGKLFDENANFNGRIVNWVVLFNDLDICLDYSDETDHKELTIQQLRDLVVLHRNDVGDANYIHQKTGLKYFVTAMNDYYFWSEKWEESYDVFSIGNLKPITNQKTIGKIPYLIKTTDKWEEQQLASDTPESATCLRIPDGAEYYAEDSILGRKVCEFFRIDPLLNHTYIDGNWEPRRFDKSRQYVLWQRKPEIMPMHCATVKVSEDVLISAIEAFDAYMNGHVVYVKNIKIDDDFVDHQTLDQYGIEIFKNPDYFYKLKPKNPNHWR